jgi:hypothetical protein
MIIGILILIVIGVGLALLIRGRSNPLLRTLFWPAFFFKVLGGISIGLLYTHYYSNGDTFGFFADALRLSAYAREDFSGFVKFIFIHDSQHAIIEQFHNTQDRSIFFIKIVSVFNLLSNDNYWITATYFSIISFFSGWHLVSVFIRHFPNQCHAVVLSFLFLPSFVVWSSGVIKESLAIAALFYIITLFIRLWFRERLGFVHYLMLFAAIYTVWFLKYYYLGVLLPVMISVAIVQIFSKWYRLRLWHEITALAFIAIFLFFLVTFLHPNFNTHRFLNVVVQNNEAFMQISDASDVIHYYKLAPNWSSIMLNAPWALVSGLFRPFILEGKTVFQLLASLENLAILMLTLVSLKKITMLQSTSDRLLVIGALLYVLLLCLFLSLSTPNFGTLIRYRIGFLPIFVLLVADVPIVRKLWDKIV